MLSIRISHTIAENYAICFNHTASFVGCVFGVIADSGQTSDITHREPLLPTAFAKNRDIIFFILTAVYVFSYGPEQKKSNSKGSIEEINTRND